VARLERAAYLLGALLVVFVCAGRNHQNTEPTKALISTQRAFLSVLSASSVKSVFLSPPYSRVKTISRARYARVAKGAPLALWPCWPTWPPCQPDNNPTSAWERSPGRAASTETQERGHRLRATIGASCRYADRSSTPTRPTRRPIHRRRRAPAIGTPSAWRGGCRDYDFSPASLRTAARVCGASRKRSAWSLSRSGATTSTRPARLASSSNPNVPVKRRPNVSATRRASASSSTATASRDPEPT
jgi:hypothetical protein